MNIYEIILYEGDLSNKDHYIMAENFKDAVAQAEKLLVKFRKECEDSEIISITKKFELEVVKQQ